MAGEALVIGFGNPLRGDDGIGPAVAAGMAAREFPGVTVRTVHQLTPELAADLANVQRVIFVDAATVGDPVTVSRLQPAEAGGTISHVLDPRTVLALAWAVYGRVPEAVLVAVRGTVFDGCDRLSPTAQENARQACQRIEEMLRDR